MLRAVLLSVAVYQNAHTFCCLTQNQTNESRKKREKLKFSVERSSVCNILEEFAEHGIHCLPCCNTNNATSN